MISHPKGRSEEPHVTAYEAGRSQANTGLPWGTSPLLLAFAVLTTFATITLYVLSDRTDQLFAWTIQPPVTAAFLGAGYGAGLIAVLLSLRIRRWRPVLCGRHLAPSP
jgi:hypothetical protein